VADFRANEKFYLSATYQELAGAQSDKDKDFYTNRCDGLDRQIDALVYDLYGLTADEIKIVEGNH